MAKRVKHKKKGLTKDSLGLQKATESWVQATLRAPLKDSSDIAEILVIENGDLTSKSCRSLWSQLEDWQVKKLKNFSRSFVELHTESKPVFVLNLKTEPDSKAKRHGGFQEVSKFSNARDSIGEVFNILAKERPSLLKLTVARPNKEIARGLLTGLDLAAYRFQERLNKDNFQWQPKLDVFNGTSRLSATSIAEATDLAGGVNLARHLVNLPAGYLNPQTYATEIKALFQKSSTVKVEVWDQERLRKEKMGMHLAVGQAAEHPPCLIHLRYRPKGGAAKKPIAFVGKGITFDSGGLDIKPPPYMRHMKKDMGGSAAVAGLLCWAEKANLKIPIDAYLAVAENAIAANAFRPGDILTARNGLTVEIHNTDAEGRLVLGDALSVASSQTEKNEPRYVIDVATLTGAVKASLGAHVAGLFSNDDKLREKIFASSQISGDSCWPLPLYQPYNKMLSSTVAKLANCADGYGGAVTAALFLENFVNEKSWAHLDIYAFKDSSAGNHFEPGGSGQGVQVLADFLTRLR